MTSTQAARLLGVGQREVQRLTQQAGLTVVGTVGRALLLDPISVHRHAAHRVAVGRPWSPATAWAAIDMFVGGHADWLDATRRRRLRARLANLTAERFVWLARRRADEHCYFGWRGQLAQLREAVIPTATSIDEGELEALFELLPDSARVSGYVSRTDLPALVRHFELRPAPVGNVTLLVTTDAVQVRPAALLAALDLGSSIDPRERSAGLRVLRDNLDGFRP